VPDERVDLHRSDIDGIAPLRGIGEEHPGTDTTDMPIAPDYIFPNGNFCPQYRAVDNLELYGQELSACRHVEALGVFDVKREFVDTFGHWSVLRFVGLLYLGVKE
jgi:hypothetical protein